MHRISKLKNIKLLSLLILVALAGLAGYVYFKPFAKTEQLTPVPKETVNYTEATDEEKSASEAHKDELAKEAASKPKNSEGTAAQVTPFISYWGQATPGQNLKVGGYVSGIIEDTGTCTLTLEKEGKIVTSTISSKKDAKTTSCSAFDIAYSSISPGVWNAILKYTSPTSNGSSEITKIEVK